MHIPGFIDRRTILRARRLWLHYGVFWLGAIATGLVAVMYARLIDFGYDAFLRVVAVYWWLPLLLTPAIGALAVWLTRRFFPGSEGSGIPQVIAMLHDKRELGPRLLTLRILVGKIAISFLSILGGFTIGREGPTIHVGAALMFSLRRFYPTRLRNMRGGALERNLALAGAAAGLSAAFNAPLAGVVFAIEELTRSFEQRTSGVLITAIIFAGIVSLALQGNYVYFGTIDLTGHFPESLALAVVLLGVVTGIAGGIFCWLLLNTERWMPGRLASWRQTHPVAFGAACGLVIAVIGVVAGGHTFGSGYAEARGMLEGHTEVGASYPLLKMASMVGSYLPGAPGGLFAPSLAIGAGIGNALHLVFGNMELPMLIALGMVGYLAAVTQSPITAFVIVIEMINGHALVLSLMATALIASQVSKLFAPPLYEALAQKYMGK
ncbi:MULTISPECIES: chloride channel protein [Caballeronia]|jgi:H+/Cl- antiporter ClcA|uniref:Chloride channel protein n=1 Tax=Caballeronia zhejiangensis TaxID=871203 RepID=A0A656QMI8_9BURK|nr:MULTISPECIES: chloride channel protein [Caballeronia]EKS71257.1 chloride channel core [Burkholderia sp. SJ98]KDR32121.1 chloride channel protein [Caballeronia zhejiangensis]MCG7403970.1 chloride channel protein [Caballeronia zhejiangensis]MCI1045461.1 chloride channel protein [Caballeronia zhejiangensis]MDR5790641.1 chloride channel protein [Caballeronia sp. LP003]